MENGSKWLWDPLLHENYVAQITDNGKSRRGRGQSVLTYQESEHMVVCKEKEKRETRDEVQGSTSEWDQLYYLLTCVINFPISCLQTTVMWWSYLCSSSIVCWPRLESPTFLHVADHCEESGWWLAGLGGGMALLSLVLPTQQACSGLFPWRCSKIPTCTWLLETKSLQ